MSEKKSEIKEAQLGDICKSCDGYIKNECEGDKTAYYPPRCYHNEIEEAQQLEDEARREEENEEQMLYYCGPDSKYDLDDQDDNNGKETI